MDLLGAKENTVRVAINRDLKPKNLIEDTGRRRKGSKIWKLKEDKEGKPNIENNEFINELLEENYETNKFLMMFFQENKGKLQEQAFDKQKDFKKVIEIMDKTKKAIDGDTE